ncbi:MAG TPA: hypothetical protein VGO93_01970 [Candidatus Xenobia bacterium]|jgi:hypothetical protein
MPTIGQQKARPPVVSPVLDLARPFPGEKAEDLTSAARVDAALIGGHVPSEDDSWQVPGVQSHPAQMASEWMRKSDKNWYRFGLGAKIVGSAGLTAALATVFLGTTAATAGIAALPLALIGGAVGAGFGFLSFRRHGKGSIEIDNDGDVRKTRFHIHPDNQASTPAELRSILLANGSIGDSIDLAPTGKMPKAKAALEPQVDAQRKKLMDLDHDRRLMADFGGKSRYGHEALQVVDAATARQLMAAGKPIYVVDAEQPTETRHHYNVTAHTPDKKVTRVVADEYSERKMGYGLTRIDKPEQLGEVSQGAGLPEGMVGVYKNGTQVSQIVYGSNQEQMRRIDGDNRSQSSAASEMIKDGSVERAQQLDGQKAFKVHQRTGFGPIGGLMGALVGAAIIGVVFPPALLAGMAVGAVGGFFGTERLVEHSMEKSQQKFQERQAARDAEFEATMARIQNEAAGQ